MVREVQGQGPVGDLKGATPPLRKRISHILKPKLGLSWKKSAKSSDNLMKLCLITFKLIVAKGNNVSSISHFQVRQPRKNADKETGS